MSELELVELEPMPGRRMPIDRELTIGRHECDLTVSDPQVSRHHASLAPAGGGGTITDLGSRNGTWVNDERVEGERVLRSGDIVRIGETRWEVAMPDAAAAATERAPRGDVPAPPPSGVRDVPAPVAVAERPPSTEMLEREQRPAASAARRTEATLICYAVVVLTAIAVIVYLIAR